MKERKIYDNILAAAGIILCVISGVLIGRDCECRIFLDQRAMFIAVMLITLAVVIRNKIRDIAIIIGAVSQMLYLWKNYDIISEKITSGLISYIIRYMKLWNEYYKTDISIPGLVSQNEEYALTYVTILMLVVMYFLYRITKKSILFIIYPIILLAADMLVGYTPGYAGLGYMFAAAFTLLASHHTGNIKQKTYAAIIIAAFAIASPYIFEKPAEYMMEYKEEIREYEKNLEYAVNDFINYGLVSNDGSVSNDTPEYSGKEIMKVSISVNEKAVKEWVNYLKEFGISCYGFDNSIYFKGYQGSDYIGGKWAYDKKSFRKYLNEAKLTEEDIAKVFEEKITSAYNPDEENILLEKIEYYKKDNKAYIPYLARVSEGAKENELKAVSDTLYTKNKDKNEIEMPCETELFTELYGFDYCDTGGESADYWEEYAKYYEKESGKNNSENIEYVYESIEDHASEFYEKYSKYVFENYLDIPRNQQASGRIAKQILEESEYDFEKYYNSDKFMVRNSARQKMVNCVAEYLDDNYIYSLYLDDNKKTDPIEYFLVVSKQGYCVHFASAAVMILRQMGIPARYVTGYVNFAGNLKQNENNQMEAVIQDYAKHAWIEVYMEKYGWVPYEMTPSYNRYSKELPTTWSKEETQEKVKIKQEIIKKRNEQEEKKKGTAGKQTASPKPVSTARPAGHSAAPRSVETNIRINKAFIIVAAMVMTSFVLLIIMIVRRRRYPLAAKALIVKGRYNKAIRTTNETLYRHLLRKTGKAKLIKNDEQFYELVKSTYELDENDVRKYAEIVKKAVYSNIKCSEEEARYCENLVDKLS